MDVKLLITLLFINFRCETESKVGFKQMTAAKFMQLKTELAGDKLIDETPTSFANFRRLLLEGPAKDDKQYEAYKNVRQRINKWR